jgi:hypothetical protein
MAEGSMAGGPVPKRWKAVAAGERQTLAGVHGDRRRSARRSANAPRADLAAANP